MLGSLITLGLLTLLQAVLGFDNLLYISLESKRAPAAKQTFVRRWGIAIAVVLRILLLFALLKIVQHLQEPLFGFHSYVIDVDPSVHSLVMLAGGVFIIYTAVKEIFHMMNFDEAHGESRKDASVSVIIFWIVAMNIVFSFDSILSAMALTDVFWVMALAIVIGGALMMWLADRVSSFLQKNRIYEGLGLFVLFVVGIMLLAEGGHLAHLHFFGRIITPMSKTTFYFVIFVLVLTDIVQSRYQRKLMKQGEL